MVFDRDIGYGFEGILSYELKAALYAGDNHPEIRSFIVGLGGRDVTHDDLYHGVKKAIAERGNPDIQASVHTEFIGMQLEELGFKKEVN